MNIQTNIPLSTLTTMKIGGPANYVADVTNQEELQNVCQNAKKINQPVYVIGGGSNLIVHDEGFQGIIVHNKIPGIEIVSEDDDAINVKAGGGELWDALVAYTVEKGLSGIEAMSGIPGTVGAAPVQNIGAYGQELGDTFISLQAFDLTTGQFTDISWEECKFTYRHSIFRGEAIGRYIIVTVTLRLLRSPPEPPFYDSLQKYFDSNSITEYSAKTVRDAVLAIRSDKLPDPNIVPNAGSFFKNALVENWKVNDIRTTYPEMPAFPFDDNHQKIPAGWLIENCDLKGSVLYGMKIHDDNAVVLINQSATSYTDLAAAREEIMSTVRDKFQIMLEQEPLEL